MCLYGHGPNPNRRKGWTGTLSIQNVVRKIIIFLLLLWAIDWPQPIWSASQTSEQIADLTSEQAAKDFDQFWREIGDHYAYFEKKKVSWQEVRELYRPRALKCHKRLELLHVMEDAIAELADDHATMGADGPNSPRIVPSKTDVWPSWHGAAAILDEVRPGGAAALAGLKSGNRIISVNGQSIEKAVEAELPKSWSSYDAEVRDWALRRVLAGR